MSRRKMFWGSILALGFFSAGLLFAQRPPAQDCNGSAHPATAPTSPTR